MKEIIEKIYNNCYCEMTINNIERQNLWKRAYINLGIALKKTIGDEK